MRILKNKPFHRWAKGVGISDISLINSVNDLTEGTYEAILGGNLYKKRISIGNRGKSSGVRTIIAFKTRGNAIFIYGFAKNERDNITENEKQALKLLAKIYLHYDEVHINQAIQAGELIEVHYEKINS